MRIPGGDHLPAGDLGAFLRRDRGAIRNLVALALTAELVHHADLARARYRDQVTLLVFHGLDAMEPQRALVADLHAGGRRGPRGRATDVERAHVQLRAGLADRLRRDHTDRFANVDQPATRQIASVAVRAHAIARGAGDRRAHLDLVHALLLQEAHGLLIQQRTAGYQHFLFTRLLPVGRDHAAEHALAQALDHVAAFDQGGHCETVSGPAIL